MPASARAGTTPLWKMSAWRSSSSATLALMARSCSVGVSPSGDVPPILASCCSLSRATRTWKNSSRLLLKMARNFTRSSTGARSSAARASTRPLKSSQDSSRLR